MPPKRFPSKRSSKRKVRERDEDDSNPPMNDQEKQDLSAASAENGGVCKKLKVLHLDSQEMNNVDFTDVNDHGDVAGALIPEETTREESESSKEDICSPPRGLTRHSRKSLPRRSQYLCPPKLVLPNDGSKWNHLAAKVNFPAEAMEEGMLGRYLVELWTTNPPRENVDEVIPNDKIEEVNPDMVYDEDTGREDSQYSDESIADSMLIYDPSDDETTFYNNSHDSGGEYRHATVDHSAHENYGRDANGEEVAMTTFEYFRLPTTKLRLYEPPTEAENADENMNEDDEIKLHCRYCNSTNHNHRH